MVIQEWFAFFRAEVFFVYGLAFFVMGFAIMLQPKKFSTIPLAKSLKYLALFGIIHGFVEWGIMFIIFQEAYLQIDVVKNIVIFKTLINAVSFMFIFMFGASLYLETINRYKKLIVLPIFIFIAWLVLFIATKELMFSSFRSWIDTSNAWSRYLLAFPGSLLAAIAITMQNKVLILKKLHLSSRVIYIFSGAFFGYAIFGGLITPPTEYWLGQTINTKIFFSKVGIPVYIFRAACGILMAYCSVRLLRIFKQDFDRQLEQAQIINSIFNERERFSRDLHDGIIQSVYGVGLYLENASINARTKPETTLQYISQAQEKLTNIISEIREYISDLRGHLDGKHSNNLVIADILKVIQDFKEYSNIKVDLTYDKNVCKLVASADVVRALRLIVFELLTNVIKHAQATEVKITINYSDDIWKMEVIDNGIGIEKHNDKKSNGYRLGLKNINERAHEINGTFKITNLADRGTRAELIVRGEIRHE